MKYVTWGTFTYSEIPANFGTHARSSTPTPKVALAARSIKRHADTVTEFNSKLLDALKRKEVDKAAYIRYFAYLPGPCSSMR